MIPVASWDAHPSAEKKNKKSAERSCSLLAFSSPELLEKVIERERECLSPDESHPNLKHPHSVHDMCESPFIPTKNQGFWGCIKHYKTKGIFQQMHPSHGQVRANIVQLNMAHINRNWLQPPWSSQVPQSQRCWDF